MRRAPENPEHGDYSAEFGWYSEVLGGWIRDPAKIGRVIPEPEITESARREFAEMNGPRKFKPQTNMEQLIKLRSSELPEDRQTFHSIAKGTTRMQLHDYEKAKAKAAPPKEEE